MSRDTRRRAQEFRGMLLRNLSVRLSYWHVRRARKLGDGNVSDGIRYAIETAKEKDEE